MGIHARAITATHSLYNPAPDSLPFAMKPALFKLAVTIWLFFTSACCQLPSDHTQTSTASTIWLEGQAFDGDIAAIHLLGQQLDNAWDRRNADDFSALFIPSGSFRFPGGTLLEGRDRICNYYQSTAFPSFDADLIHQTTPKRIHLLDANNAIADGVVHFLHTEAERPEDRLDLVLFVSSTLVKRDGRWRIAAVRLIPVS